MTARWGALVLIPVLLPMAGCTQYWAKPGGTQEQFAVTKSACQAQSYAQFPPAPQQVMLTAGYTTPQQSTCSGNGYMVNCYTTGGQYMPPTYVTLDQNSGARDSGFQSCLMNAGWRLAKNKEEAEAITRSGYAPPVTTAPASLTFSSASAQRAVRYCDEIFKLKPNVAMMAVFANNYDTCFQTRVRE